MDIPASIARRILRRCSLCGFARSASWNNPTPITSDQIPDSFITQAVDTAAAGYRSRSTSQSRIQWYLPFRPICTGVWVKVTIQGQLDRPYPQYSPTLTAQFGCCGSNYNALQATVTRRFQGGGTLLVAYTNSKLMSNTDTLTSWLEGGRQAAWGRSRTGTT